MQLIFEEHEIFQYKITETSERYHTLRYMRDLMKSSEIEADYHFKFSNDSEPLKYNFFFFF